MPIFLDRHDVVEFSAEEVAKLHVKDLEIQDQYGVKFLTYWYDAERRTTFCLVDAPDKETADRVHAEAHGHVANQMIAVDLSAVEAFLGRIQDPPTAKTKPIDDSAFRAIMFTDMVGSTEMTAQLGDAMSIELLRAHDAIIRRCLEHHRGSEVKHLGDGIMASLTMPRLQSHAPSGFRRNSRPTTKTARPPFMYGSASMSANRWQRATIFLVRRCKWRRGSAISPKQTLSSCLVRSGMRVPVPIWCSSPRVLRR